MNKSNGECLCVLFTLCNYVVVGDVITVKSISVVHPVAIATSKQASYIAN